jgi:glucan phosphoethanolaminetransferase (alkaline phosphatase superfamily)
LTYLVPSGNSRSFVLIKIPSNRFLNLESCNFFVFSFCELTVFYHSVDNISLAFDLSSIIIAIVGFVIVVAVIVFLIRVLAPLIVAIIVIAIIIVIVAAIFQTGH